MFLYIVRHAEAIDRDNKLPDADRYLTAHGHKTSAKLPSQMAAYGPKPQVIISSPLLRAKQTAKNIAAQSRRVKKIMISNSLLPEKDGLALMNLLKKFPRAESQLWVGHEPQLSEFLAIVLDKPSDSFHLKKGACVLLKFDQHKNSKIKFVGSLIPGNKLVRSFKKAFILGAGKKIQSTVSSYFNTLPFQKKIKLLLLSKWKIVLQLRKKALKSRGRSAIHHFRSALRRFRSQLDYSEKLVFIPHQKKLYAHCKRLIKKLGKIRNIDEAIYYFQKNGKVSPAIKKQAYKLLSEKRALEIKRVMHALKHFDPQQLKNVDQERRPLLQARLLNEPEKQFLTTFNSHFSLCFLRKTQKIIATSTLASNAKTRHALRIILRRWRYFLEIDKLIRGGSDNRLTLLKKYQVVLGRMNDLTIFKKLYHATFKELIGPKLLHEQLAAEEKFLLNRFATLLIQKPLAYPGSTVKAKLAKRLKMSK